MTHLGLVSISFRKYTAEKIIEETKKAGLCCIEWGSDVHAPCQDHKTLYRIADMQRAAGLFCSSYGTYFRLGSDPVEELSSYINAARILGTNVLRLWCGNKGSAEYTAAELEELYAQCKAAARIAGELGVILCMECHNHTLTDDPRAALALMRTVDSPCFRMYWQPNQWRTPEENLNYAEMLREYIQHIHVFFWVGEERFALNQGQKLWKEWLQRLLAAEKKSAVQEGRALLLEFMPDDRMESLAEEARTLKNIAEEWI